MYVFFTASDKSAGDLTTQTFGYAFFSKRSVRDPQKEAQKQQTTANTINTHSKAGSYDNLED